LLPVRDKFLNFQADLSRRLQSDKFLFFCTVLFHYDKEMPTTPGILAMGQRDIPGYANRAARFSEASAYHYFRFLYKSKLVKLIYDGRRTFFALDHKASNAAAFSKLFREATDRYNVWAQQMEFAREVDSRKRRLKKKVDREPSRE